MTQWCVCRCYKTFSNGHLGGSHKNKQNQQFYTNCGTFGGPRQIHMSCQWQWVLKTVSDQTETVRLHYGRSDQDDGHRESSNPMAWGRTAAGPAIWIMHEHILLLSFIKTKSKKHLYFSAAITSSSLCLETSYEISRERGNKSRLKKFGKRKKVNSYCSHEWASVTSCLLGQEIPPRVCLQGKYTPILQREIIIKVLCFHI